MNRRHFIQGALLSISGLATWLLAACGKSSDGTCTSGDGKVTYTNPGHSHTTTNLSAAQIRAATAGNYQLMSGGHTHTFALTSADFQKLAAGQAVQVQDREGDGHLISIAVC